MLGSGITERRSKAGLAGINFLISFFLFVFFILHIIYTVFRSRKQRQSAVKTTVPSMTILTHVRYMRNNMK